MSIHRNRPIDQEDAERILRGDPAARAGRARLDGVLAAAAAPAGAWEWAGEDAAAAAFAAAHLASPPERRRTSRLKSGVAKLLTVKAAAACLAIGGAGVALAAGTGVLPSPLNKPPAQHSVDPSPSTHPRPSGRPSRRPGLSIPPAELLKLCQRYADDPDSTRLDDLDRPEFGKLVERTGGKDRDRVDRFCADVLESDPSGTPGDYPDESDESDDSDRPHGPESPDGPDGPHGPDGHDDPDGPP